jgi:hypothetical protein
VFTRADLSTLLASAPSPAVSIFLPTHVLGSEIRQGPIRLKNLVGEAEAKLAATGLPAAQIEQIVGPALALQHRDRGLALFLDAGGARRFTVPIPLAEDVTVGTGFRVRPLLPVLAADGAFLVVTVTADTVRLFDASRFAVTEIQLPDVPRGRDEPGGSDYQNPVQASPPARPHTGTANISHAQVYGDSPPEWRKSRLVEYVRRVAAAVGQRLAADPVPVVLVADTEIAGHFGKAADLGPLLAGVLDVNPGSMDDGQLHEAAYAVVRPRLDADRADAVRQVEALLGRRDTRATTDLEYVVAAAQEGRVDTLLLAQEEPARGGHDGLGDPATSGDDPVDTAAVGTLLLGGTVHVLRREEMPAGGPVAAILRY